MYPRGLYVGRFQPLHFGHLSVIKEILQDVEELIIVIGSAQYSHSMDNPFTAGERLTMVRNALEEIEIAYSRFWIVPVPDLHLHMLWVSALKGYTPTFNVVYTNEPLTRRLFIESGCEVKSVCFYQRQKYSSTEIRKRIIHNENWEELVPKSVASFITSINGVARLQDLTKSDKV